MQIILSVKISQSHLSEFPSVTISHFAIEHSISSWKHSGETHDLDVTDWFPTIIRDAEDAESNTNAPGSLHVFDVYWCNKSDGCYLEFKAQFHVPDKMREVKVNGFKFISRSVICWRRLTN